MLRPLPVKKFMKFQEGRTVGIDLGTTFSTLAYLNDEGVPVPVVNDDGEQELPSLILLADSGHVVVGPNRMRAAMEDPEMSLSGSNGIWVKPRKNIKKHLTAEK